MLRHRQTDGKNDNKIYRLNDDKLPNKNNSTVNWGGLLSEKHAENLKTNSQEIDMSSDLGFMIRAVFGEAGGKTEYTGGKVISEEAKLGVAEVIRNRANDKEPNSAKYGWSRYFHNKGFDTYKEVVENSGFDAIRSDKFKDPFGFIGSSTNSGIARSEFLKSVSAALNAHFYNTNTTEGALYFITPARADVPSSWKGMTKVEPQGIDPKNEFTFYKF